MASDGIWEFLDNDAVKNITMPYYEKNDPNGACKELIKRATEFWNQEDIVVDDITCIVVFFWILNCIIQFVYIFLLLQFIY